MRKGGQEQICILEKEREAAKLQLRYAIVPRAIKMDVISDDNVKLILPLAYRLLTLDLIDDGEKGTVG